MAENEGRLLPENADAERLSWPQRIVALEGAISMIAPIVLGEEMKGGQRTPGLRDRLRRVERLIVWGGGLSIFLTFIQTFSFADGIKHAVVILFGGHP